VASSLIYRSATVYDLVMRLLYGRHYHDRGQAIADLVPEGASVLDLCCGPGFLYERYLRRKHVDYLGLDVNTRFARRVEGLGARAEVCDLRCVETLPTADFVIMQASLYQFLPDVGPILDRMRAAATVAMIVAEPVRNLSSSRIPIVAALARRSSDPGLGTGRLRFDEPSLDAVFQDRGWRVSTSRISGGREKIYVIEGSGPRLSTPSASNPVS
jgi:SAM-dependent methyltransferase